MQADRSLRSVFVGNIPYDATEEKLRDIFSAVGPVLSFRIVFDRETGKPKGYGFCEYKDQETATSAIRNLNGHDLGGRQLRVDSASNERSRDEPDQSQQPQQDPNLPPTGDPGIQAQLQTQTQQVSEPLVDAQTVINNLLCSLPPEQLFDVCKQLKSSLLINPHETRQLLSQNPQLTFAVLQTLVMIKAIDAQTAMNTIHKPLMQPAPLQLQPMPMMASMMQPQVIQPFPFVAGPPQPQAAGPMRVQAPGGPQGPMIVPNQPQQGPHQGPPQPAPQPAQMPPMSGPDMTSSGPVAPNDPRLMRQQQQQQQQTWPFPAM